MIEVRLFAFFREGRDKISYLSEETFPTPRAILEYLGIEENKVAILLVNGFHSEFEHRLKDGDVLAVFPPVAGG